MAYKSTRFFSDIQIYMYLLYTERYILYTEIKSKSTEPIDVVNISPLDSNPKPRQHHLSTYRRDQLRH